MTKKKENVVGSTENFSAKQKQSKFKQFIYEQRSYLVLGVFALMAMGITYILYSYTARLLTDRLQERLVAIAATAATQFDAETLEKIQSPEDVSKPEFARTVEQLSAIREANANIQFAYIMRRTKNPLILEFIADADALTDPSELDENNNGQLDEEEMPPLPGDSYDASEYPVLRDQAFYEPSVDRELQPDQWGLIMAAYAPIKDINGNTVAIIGLDVIVNDFNERTQETLLPFILFILFLLSVLSLLTLLLVRFWRQRVDALKEIDKQKDELLSLVSHQLATPITSIKWYVEMLLDGDLGALKKEQKETLSNMSAISTNLSDLVGMILDMSRIELGRIKIDSQPLDLKSFFKEILDVIEPKASEKKVIFTKKIPESFPSATLDKRYTRMTIENLLSNAIKYTSNGGKVDLVISISNNILHCSVKDTGVGIPLKDQSRMFEKSFRASNVRNSVDGNGFGLYIAKGSIEAQGGKIWFESEEGKGTTFFIELPLKAKLN